MIFVTQQRFPVQILQPGVLQLDVVTGHHEQELPATVLRVQLVMILAARVEDGLGTGHLW